MMARFFATRIGTRFSVLVVAQIVAPLSIPRQIRVGRVRQRERDRFELVV